MKKVLIIGATLIALSTAAQAQPGGEGNNTNCNGQGNPNSPCQGGGNGGNGGAGGTGIGVAIQGQIQAQQQMQNQLQNQGQSQSSKNTNANVNANRNANRNTNSNANNNGNNISISNNGNGNGGGTISGFQFPQIPVSTAWAPALAALAPAQCVLSATGSGGAQFLTVGLSAGAGWTHPYEECNVREAMKVIGSLPPGSVINGVPADRIMTAMAMQLSGVNKALHALNQPTQVAQVSPSAAPVPVAATAAQPAPVPVAATSRRADFPRGEAGTVQCLNTYGVAACQ